MATNNTALSKSIWKDQMSAEDHDDGYTTSSFDAQFEAVMARHRRQRNLALASIILASVVGATLGYLMKNSGF